MKILVVGAGAVGGYFGGRLLEKGEDVTFLVRERRKRQLQETGLVLKSINGDVTLEPALIESGENVEPYDVVILSMKAYHLEKAINDLRPYVGPKTVIIPLLNGISHIDQLVTAFNESNVIGGLCYVESTLNEDGHIIQTSGLHDLVFGERTAENTERMTKLQQAFSGAKGNYILSENINREMWHKYLFISTLSGVTSLFRSPIGPIRDDEFGAATIRSTLKEASSIMRSVHAPLADDIVEINWNKLHSIGHKMKSSLQRDMEKGVAVEGDHFYGYLLRIAKEKEISAPTIEKIYANLRIYENQ
ncbi:2-dehydropantoate 2-reductase [Bacillus pakistanensis]|uniref:2-dehydropantoate 2-reductase n=1 Tax=Rossellomorea pakistanensis TaxID=992288 RepID=A0ABS2N9I2_9BACI|nr:ketopantoate reductase family protein [Bacillus pakistanensis]MBM7584527.1 2-dehydropantoate 2-reductase [Bacillus pakistanensis]